MPLVSNSSHALELLKQLDQSLSQSAHKGDQQAFNRALAMEQGMNAHKPTTIPSYGQTVPQDKPGSNQGTNLGPSHSQNSSNLSSGSTSISGSNLNQANSATGAAKANVATASFNATGNLSSTSNLQDFKLLNQQNVLMQQVLNMSKTISTTKANVATASFNATGNLSSTSNLQDFKLLNQQNVLMQQVLNMSKTISTTQASALQPSVMISLGMLQKLYEMIELRTRNRNNSLLMNNTNASAANNADDLAAAQQAQVLSFVMIERFLKLFENGEKYNILSRFFKKGPLGENEHETDTDDEYGNSYADVDAETDYIKRSLKMERNTTSSPASLKRAL